ncbi:MAG TPA: 50S ribosomal protein L32 [Candidatus Binatia bacterium]|nr:50S ribosomal protein L32 [Candidatus Binatia bacterium]
MPVPKRRTSSSKKRKRRAHDALTLPQWIECANCGERIQPHRACSGCGHYKGRRVIEIAEA